MNLLRLITARGGKAYDPNANAFFTAAGITDPTQKDAVNQLVLDLKGYGIWSKMTALYPFVGNTQSTCSYNLVNPAQYQISFTLGTGSFSASGWVQGTNSGTAGYADTNLNPYALGMSTGNIHVSYYTNSPDQTQTGAQDFGINASNAANTWWLSICANFGGLGILAASTGTPYFTNYAGNGVGFYIATASGGKLYGIKNTTTYLNNSITSGSYPSNLSNVYLGCRAIFFDGKSKSRWAFASVGQGLTQAEASNLYTAVQAFQTTLGRQV